MIRAVRIKDVVGSTWLCKRYVSGECSSAAQQKGLVVGVYEGCAPGEFKPTPTFSRYDAKINNKLSELMRGSELKAGHAQVFSNISPDFNSIAVVHLGPEGAGYNLLERLDECKENIRVGAAVGARALQDNDIGTVFVEGFTNTEPAAEGAFLGVWRFQDFKDPEKKKASIRLELYEAEDIDGWVRGKAKAESQNLARWLSETPANLMTPTIFAQMVVDALCNCGVTVDVKDADWLELKKMHATLLMAKGSCEPPLFLELSYCGGDEGPPVILTGKGVTFDSGGLCLKKCPSMSEYRADVAGGAVVISAMKAIAQMSLPINVIGLVPLIENMIGGMAAKPGDIVRIRDGKSIRIEDTDNEGRVIMADAIAYGGTFKPCLLINIATLTPGIKKALGTGTSGIFTNSRTVFQEFERAGSETGDRVWRMPLWKFYSKRVQDFPGVDVHNIGSGYGNPGLAAAFLNEFAPPSDFAHIDITGTGMLANGIGHPYYRKDTMTGRPTRTIFQFMYQIGCPHDKGDDC